MKSLKTMMANLKKRFLALFSKPERKLKAMKPELQEFRMALQSALHTSNPLAEIPHFFNATSKWQDRGGIRYLISEYERVNYGQHDTLVRKLRTLDQHLQSVGRNQFGWNRTKPGETVTKDRVYLGNIHGLLTHPIPFWEQKQHEGKGGWGDPTLENYNSYDVVSRQARHFMISRARPMVEIIDHLEARVA